MLTPPKSLVAPPSPAVPEPVAPGVWRWRFGTPETITPVVSRRFQPSTSGWETLPVTGQCPVDVAATFSSRGCLIRIPLVADELIYGLGLQLQSFQQRGCKKTVRVNADPAVDTGDSHAPVPFYVTTRGYGVLVDTARYATFYFGNKRTKPGFAAERPADDGRDDGWNGVPPYQQRGLGDASEVLIEVPAPGVDIYIFAGPSLRNAVQRYNLFSGGGVLPPRWGLGFWYRTETNYTQADILALTAELRERKIPCDVIGLEPHWQSHSYSCSYRWSDRFPEPAAMLRKLRGEGFRVNLWEHPFVHPSSSIYGELLPYAGDYEVWGGLVPDFLEPKAREVFARHHRSAHVDIGVAGYKLDECDNSDFTGGWSFPEASRFPSGADGEQMHQLLGLRYQDAILEVFEPRRQRTLGLVRSSGALAAPYPFVLYSDLYNHRQFVHGVAQSAFSGLLWTPEVRHARTPEELVRRLQAVVLSPLAMINAWYLRHPPWKQMQREANHAGELAPDWLEVEARCREVIALRMRLVPSYLQAAFARYHREGLPPFRPLVMDFPDDAEVINLSDQYLIGDSLMAAPIIVPDAVREQEQALIVPRQRSVYLPKGDWYDFWSNERYSGGCRVVLDVPLERAPLFVRAGTILPLATVTQHTDNPQSLELEARVYGDGADGGLLVEDNGEQPIDLKVRRLAWDIRVGAGVVEPSVPGYRIVKWVRIP